MLSYGGLLKQKYKILNLDDAEDGNLINTSDEDKTCLLYTSPSPRDKRQSRMPSSA